MAQETFSHEPEIGPPEPKEGEKEALKNEIDKTTLLSKGEEFYVLYKLLDSEGLAPINPNCDIYELRRPFTKERAQNHFGFYYENGGWHTADVSRWGPYPTGVLYNPGNLHRDLSIDETFETQNFLEAYDQYQGIRYELAEDTGDAPQFEDTDVEDVAHFIDQFRREYAEHKRGEEGESSEVNSKIS